MITTVGDKRAAKLTNEIPQTGKCRVEECSLIGSELDYANFVLYISHKSFHTAIRF